MGMKHFEKAICVGFCVFVILLFSSQSFSSDTVVSVLPEPNNPFKNGNASSYEWGSAVFNAWEAEIPSTGFEGIIKPSSYLPPVEYMYVFINGTKCVGHNETPPVNVHQGDGDGIQVWVEYKFKDVSWSDPYGDRFMVIHTPPVPMHPQGAWFSWVNGKLEKGIWGEKVEITSNKVWKGVIGLVAAANFSSGDYQICLGFDEIQNYQLDSDSLIYVCGIARLNPIKLDLSASPLSGEAPLKVNFYLTVTDSYKESIDTCKLMVEDQEYGCALMNTHTFESAGNYKVWAEVKDVAGHFVFSDPVTITVESTPVNQPPTISNLSVTPGSVSSDEEFTIHYYYDDPDGKDDVDRHVIGIGTWSKEYGAEGSGQFQHSYSFGEETTPGTHYIDVYVIDSAGNHSNTLSSSIDYEGGAKECGTFTEAGSDLAETHTVEMGQTSGRFWFEYDTMTKKDRIFIYYGDTEIFDSGCVGTQGTTSAHLKFGPGNSTQIKVAVQPNCPSGSGTGTQWNFTVRCPDSGPY